jgi:ribosomal protein S18 acetylase RimI-like enzyme
MPGSVRFSDPLDLRALAPSILSQLPALTRTVGRFRTLLSERPACLVVVALDARGVVGWATAEPDGLLGVFVAVRRRRQGIGAELATRARRALEARWPGVEWRASAEPGTPGRAFWESVRARWMAQERAA